MADNTNDTTEETQTNARTKAKLAEINTSCGNVPLSQCPALQKCLPPGYEYHVCSVEVTQTEFDHPAVNATIRLTIKSKEEAKEWLLKTRRTPMTWRVSTNKVCSGKKVLYKVIYKCHHNVDVKRYKANYRRTSKNTDCPAKMTLTVKRQVAVKKSQSKDLHLSQYPTMIILQNIHNHNIYSAATMKHRDVGQEAIETLNKLFEKGHNPPSALSILKSNLQAKFGDNYVYIVADRATCPDLNFCYSLYKKFKKRNKARLQKCTGDQDEVTTGDQDGSSTHELEGDSDPLEEPNTGAASMDNSPNFVPSILPHARKAPGASKAKLERFERKRKRDDEPFSHRPVMDSGDPQQAIADEVALDSTESYTEATVPNSVYDDLHLNQISTQCVNVRSDTNELKAENEQLKEKLRKTEFSYRSIKNNAASVVFFTGLTCVLFEWLILKLKTSVQLVRASMSLEDHLLVILMKLRLGLGNKDLAFRFNVTEGDISKILRRWLPVMSQVLKPLIKWPSKHIVLKNMPKCFKPKYKHCRCVIDCTEIFINRPTNLNSRTQTWSTYKHHNTIKYLVGMSPAGAITFLSPGWGGRVSDQQIAVESGLLDLLERNDEILSDRGVTIRDELAVYGATVKTPHFTKDKKQVSAEKGNTSSQLSDVRIHIERIMGRWKNFKILTTVIPITQVDLLDDMVTVCGALTNLCEV